jgi:regulatory protein
MKISRITRHPRRERARIHLDGEDEPRLEIALDLLLRSGLSVGDTLAPEQVDELQAEEAASRVREAALRLLAHRARSTLELRRRLERQGVPGPLVTRTLEWLDELGYLDDRAFAEAWVRDRVRSRPRGRRALLQELRQKGVDESVGLAAMAVVLEAEGTDEAALAIGVARTWARKNASAMARARRSDEDRQGVRRRLYGHLARRGFDAAAVAAAVAGVLDD